MDEYLRLHSIDGRVHLLVINSGYEQMLLNFMHHYKRVHPEPAPPVAVLALDVTAMEQLDKHNIHSFLFEAKHWKKLQKNASSYGAASWGPIVMSKLAAIHSVLSYGYTVLYTDVDIVLHRPVDSIYRALKQQIGAEIAFQIDGNAFHSVCTGVILATPTPFCKQILCADGPDAARWKDDQLYIQKKLSTLKPTLRSKVVRLPISVYPHGNFWKKSRNRCSRPVLVHYNYVVGKAAKIGWMKRDHVWIPK